MIIGYIPVDESGNLLKGGTRRFKIYASIALALAAHGPAVGSKPVYIEEEGGWIQ